MTSKRIYLDYLEDMPNLGLQAGRILQEKGGRS
jgi:hypothetical protein